MEALPNYGEDYRRRFRAVYPALARRNGAILIPFLLDGVAGMPSLNQGDGIHPTAEGQRRVAANVWKALQPLLR
jgi:acyl-CoA thioesterase-1